MSDLMQSEKAELVKINTQLQKESLQTEEDREDLVRTLMEVKTELENLRGRLREFLEEVEAEREKNKQNLQAVEEEITQREATFDKPEELLRRKEDLLRAQWELDQTKKDNERQLLDTERLLEPIDLQVNKIHQRKEEDFRKVPLRKQTECVSSSASYCVPAMRPPVSGVLATAVALFSTVNYYFPKDDKMDNTETNALIQPSQKENEGEHVSNTVMEQEEEKPQCTKKSTKLNMTDGPFFEPAFKAVSGSMPLDTVFILLLIHTCGADLVESISKVSQHMSLGGVLVDMALSLTLAVYGMYRWKREKAELVKRNTQLQKESLQTEEDREDLVRTLMEVKTELENLRGRLREFLEEVEAEREGNKQNLQAVEEEITQREATFDKPEELLRRKEDLLQAQWELDQTKKDHERQLLDTERLLEPIDIQVHKIHRRKEEDFG
ncbi:coiled-coil domain-containing protein 18-like [Etheostoma spectabile]|uniref:coiled-coil domain-containing protein 18-like n=1 Tax=Etheostoma spectabile TaxID=54343 RepID=UPI0013AF6E9F|nr:coiled-coil domain-containing protein 18-like [Etheostoma spectabile]